MHVRHIKCGMGLFSAKSLATVFNPAHSSCQDALIVRKDRIRSTTFDHRKYKHLFDFENLLANCNIIINRGFAWVFSCTKLARFRENLKSIHIFVDRTSGFVILLVKIRHPLLVEV